MESLGGSMVPLAPVGFVPIQVKRHGDPAAYGGAGMTRPSGAPIG